MKTILILITKEKIQRLELASICSAQKVIDSTADVLGFRCFTKLNRQRRRKKLV